jgi:hypothetical protein
MTATADQQAAQNRLTIRLMFVLQTRKKEDDFENHLPFLRLSCRTTIDSATFE